MGETHVLMYVFIGVGVTRFTTWSVPLDGYMFVFVVRGFVGLMVREGQVMICLQESSQYLRCLAHGGQCHLCC
jgi:hypothetical protein